MPSAASPLGASYPLYRESFDAGCKSEREAHIPDDRPSPVESICETPIHGADESVKVSGHTRVVGIRVILGLSWGYIRVILGLCWGYTRVIFRWHCWWRASTLGMDLCSSTRTSRVSSTRHPVLTFPI